MVECIMIWQHVCESIRLVHGAADHNKQPGSMVPSCNLVCLWPVPCSHIASVAADQPIAVRRCEELASQLAKLQAASSTTSDDLAGQIKVLAAAQLSAQADSGQAVKLLGRELRSELEGLRFGAAQQKEAAAAEAAVVARQLETGRAQVGASYQWLCRAIH